MKGQPSCDVLHGLVVARWAEYAVARFGEGTRSERGGRVASRRAGEMAWSGFIARSFRLYAEQCRIARRAGGALGFEVANLQLLLLRGLESGCDLCGVVFGIEQASVVWDEHPQRFGRPEKGHQFKLGRLLPACARCSQAIDLLTAAVFRDLLMALRAEPDWVASRFLDRAGRGSSRRPPPASNAPAAAFTQAGRGKKGLSTR